MIAKFHPWDSKYNLRETLMTFKEDKQLDSLIIDYIRECLGHKIIMVPSKGPHGEGGKDIVAVENEEAGTYCSYIVKRGNLQKNLEGQFGILRQTEMAVLIDVEIDKYREGKRTAVVVHNGKERYRGAIARFEKKCRAIEKKCGALLLRPIERWDIDELVNRLFEYRDVLTKNTEIEQQMKKYELSYDVSNIFDEEYEKTINSPNPTSERAMLAEKFYNNRRSIEYRHGTFKKVKHSGIKNEQ